MALNGAKVTAYSHLLKTLPTLETLAECRNLLPYYYQL